MRRRASTGPSPFRIEQVTACSRAPGDYPSGKKGDVLTVEFTVPGIPCLRSQRRTPAFRQQPRLFSFQKSRRTLRYETTVTERDRRQWRNGKPVRLVQGTRWGPLLAITPRAANRCAFGWWRWAKRAFEADDDDEEDRRRRHEGKRGDADGVFLAWGPQRPQRPSILLTAKRGLYPVSRLTPTSPYNASAVVVTALG